MKKIAIFQRDLDLGGIQRSLINMVTNMDLSDYDIDLFLFKEPTICSLDDLADVNVIMLKPLNYLNRIVDIRLLMNSYKKVLPQKEYDLAIDFNSYSNECAICALTVNAKKRVLWIHSDLESEYKNIQKYRILFRFFKAKYELFDEFVAVSEAIIEPFRNITGMHDKPVRVISNLINTENIFMKADLPIDFEPDAGLINFLYAGRFDKAKGIDILLDYFSKALEIRQDMHLYLLGDGAERAAILEQILRLAIGGKVTVLAASDNPYAYMERVDALLLTSRHEGQGIVLWEAKALGLEIIFEKHLERYCNYQLVGAEDMVKAIVSVQRRHKERYALDDYNGKIRDSLRELFDCEAVK